MMMMSHSEEEELKFPDDLDFSDERLGLPSASGIESYMLCHGKFGAEKGMPEIKVDDGSDEGSERHLLAQYNISPALLRNVEHIKCVEKAKECIEKVRGETIKGEGYIWTEERLPLVDKGQIPFLTAKLDYAEIVPQNQRALIVDYKMLYGFHTPAYMNPQLFTQGAALMQKNKSLTEVFMMLCNPLLYPAYSITMFRRSDAQNWANEMRKLSLKIRTGQQPRTPGFKQCFHCKALTACPEAIEMLDEFMHDDIEKLFNDPQHAKRAYEMGKLCEQFSKKTKALARDRLKVGTGKIKGYKLSKPSQTAEYNNAELFRALQARGFDIGSIAKITDTVESRLIEEWSKKTGTSLSESRESLRSVMIKENACKMVPTRAKIIRDASQAA
jgi:hypothetical protein